MEGNVVGKRMAAAHEPDNSAQFGHDSREHPVAGITGVRQGKGREMVPPRVWKLHETVGCEDIYDFLGSSKEASLGDLRTAADKKYASIHNQSSRNEVARAGAELAGLCKSDILKDARRKREYDQELLARSRSEPDDSRPDNRPERQPERRPSRFVGRAALVVAVLALGLGALAVLGIAPFLQTAGGDPAAGGAESASGSAAVEPTMAPAGGSAPAIVFASPSEAEDALGLDASDRRSVQAGLAEAGFPAGPLDGLFGSGTRIAIGRWQAARGAPPTGYLDAAEAAALSELGAVRLRASASVAAPADDPPRPARAAAAPPPPSPARQSGGGGSSGGALTIRAAAASRIELDGAEVGTTGATGMLLLSDVQPGRHVIVARKEGHADATSVVEVAEGRAEVLELAMAPLPGRLTATASVADVLLRIAGVGEHRLPLDGLELPAGPHRVTASREGFRTVVSDVEIRPGALTTLDLTLEAIPVDELLQAAAGQLAAGDYRAAAEAARSVVSMRPDAGAAHRLLGTALYERGDFEESIVSLSQAIRLGQEVVLSTRHRHGGAGLREGFCSGTITLSRTAVTFVSQDEPEHGFSTTPDRVTGVQVAESSGRNAFRLNASLEDADGGRRNFDFVHKDAVRTRRERDSLFLRGVELVLTCQGCDGSLDVQAALMNYVSQLAP